MQSYTFMNYHHKEYFIIFQTYNKYIFLSDRKKLVETILLKEIQFQQASYTCNS